MRAFLERIVEALLDGGAWALEHAAELGTGLLGLLGWALLTSVAVHFVGGWAWRAGLGVLALSLFGWKFALVIARDGLYTLSGRGKRDR